MPMSAAQMEAAITALNTTIIANKASLDKEITGIKGNKELDTFYIFWAGTLVFLMQCGFATLEAGSVRFKNVRNVLLKNLLDACVGCLIWYLFGFGIAGGGNAFIGSDPANFALSGLDDTVAGYTNKGYDWISFFFSYTFAAAASTIVSGAVAERCQLGAYLIYTCVITGFIYPVVVHWVWDPSGFLSAFNPNHILGGNIDFAGSGVVHMTGGIAGLVGAAILGPRIGRFQPGESQAQFEGHSTPLQIIGTFLLWFGWYGFNGGSTLALNTYGRDMARVAVTTTLSAATSGWFGLWIKKLLPECMGGSKIYDVAHVCNSILGGLVGITAGCSVISPHGAVLTGFISAWVYHGGSCLARKLKIDDPLDAFAVHGACGFWGVMAVAFFAVPEYSYAPNSANPAYGTGADAGAFTGRADGRLFGAQIVSLLIQIVWVGGLSGIMFGALRVTGMFRVPAAVEAEGLDDSKHGGQAYTTRVVPPTDGSSKTAAA